MVFSQMALPLAVCTWQKALDAVCHGARRAVLGDQEWGFSAALWACLSFFSRCVGERVVRRRKRKGQSNHLSWSHVPFGGKFVCSQRLAKGQCILQEICEPQGCEADLPINRGDVRPPWQKPSSFILTVQLFGCDLICGSVFMGGTWKAQAVPPRNQDASLSLPLSVAASQIV